MISRWTHRFILGVILGSHFVYASVEGGELVQKWSFEFWLFAFLSAFLIIFAGLCSGLTVGYLSIKKQSLQLWLDSPDPQKVKYAETILGILENHHLLLSTLLLSNALAMQALPIFLDRIVPAYIAVFISTIAVLIFGEVIPQAYCTGPHQIPIAYYLSGFVKFLQIFFAIFVRPIAWALDHWLGHHEDKIQLSKENLKTLLQLHKSKEYGYSPQQIELLQNTLDLRSKKVEQYMIPISKIFMLDLDTNIDPSLIATIQQYNFSTIAVHHTVKHRILGIVRVKQLLGVDFNAGLRLRDCVKIQPVQFVPQGRNLLELFDMLKSRKGRFCFILKQQNQKKFFTFSEKQEGKMPLGMVNLKKILEQITLKQFRDSDFQKPIKSGEFGMLVRKANLEPVEGVQQD